MKKSTIFLIAVLWLGIVAGSYVYNATNAQSERERIAMETARSFFSEILTTRAWNAKHGGVYVPVTEDTRPNPYLKVPRREIQVNDDVQLTMINPAFMTRQISELARERDDVHVHITSLNPIRPENRAVGHEVEFLEAFEEGVREKGMFLEETGESEFFYMAALETEPGCMKCHEEQGYKVGDVRGGISVRIPWIAPPNLSPLIAAHAAISVVGLLGIFFGGNRLREAYEAVRKQSLVDALTGVSNRLHLTKILEIESQRSKRLNEPYSILMCDIDNFKLYNDTYGHGGGDECLRDVAKAIEDALLRPGDFCARYGGEEFLVLLTNTDLEGAYVVAERVRQVVVDLERVHEKSTPLGLVSLSIGVASNQEDGTTSHELVSENADKALYEAKAAGRNRVALFRG